MYNKQTAHISHLMNAFFCRLFTQPTGLPRILQLSTLQIELVFFEELFAKQQHLQITIAKIYHLANILWNKNTQKLNRSSDSRRKSLNRRHILSAMRCVHFPFGRFPWHCVRFVCVDVITCIQPCGRFSLRWTFVQQRTASHTIRIALSHVSNSSEYQL